MSFQFWRAVFVCAEKVLRRYCRHLYLLLQWSTVKIDMVEVGAVDGGVILLPPLLPISHDDDGRATDRLWI